MGFGFGFFREQILLFIASSFEKLAIRRAGEQRFLKRFFSKIAQLCNKKVFDSFQNQRLSFSLKIILAVRVGFEPTRGG